MSKNKRFVLNYAGWALGFLSLGLILLFAPGHGGLFLCYLLGVCAVIWGIVHVVLFFRKDGEPRAFDSDIPQGVVFLILGVYLFAKPQAAYSLLPVLMGFAVVYDSVVKVQHAASLKKDGFTHWWWVLAAAMVTAILGLLLIVEVFDNTLLWYFFGAVMLVDGLLDLGVIGLSLFRKKKDAKPAAAVPPPPPLPLPARPAAPPAPKAPEEK